MTNDALPLPGMVPARRYLSVALPLLPTDRVRRQRGGRNWRSLPDAAAHPPLALAARVKGALRLAALDEHAMARGLRAGMPLADARAMIPGLEAVDDDPAADAALMDEIAAWTERYTPLVALDSHDPHGLMLDITGAAHLFGGEESVAKDILSRLAGQGFSARAAIAGTPGAAFAATRHGNATVTAPGDHARLLAPMPLAALRLAGETVAAMERVGLKRIGQIISAPRAPLAARFGAQLLARLDQALGHAEEAINPRRPVPAFISERRFAEPIAREDDIAATLSSLAATLARSLEAHGEGARRLAFTLYRVDGMVREITVGASRPVRAPNLILDIFREKFSALGQDGIDAGFGFDMARLAAVATATCGDAQGDFSGDDTASADLEGLIDRIGARLGEGSVGFILPHESHLPEQAEQLVPPEAAMAMKTPSDLPALNRPLRLFTRPEPVEAMAEVPDGPPVNFRWRRAAYRVVRAEGPERIAAEWWHRDGPTRDYFRVEDANGHRFWLFREGLYEREETHPRWFMHGLFA